MRLRNKRASLLPCVVCLLLAPSTARADGIDASWLLTRVGGWDRKPLLALALFIGLMGINYLLNLALIGIPAANAGSRPRFCFSRDLLWYTVLAQVVDRVGFTLALTISTSVAALFNGNIEAALLRGILGGLVVNFLLSGLGVAMLAEFFMKARWHIPQRSARRIAVRAGIWTNPTWLIALSLSLGVLFR